MELDQRFRDREAKPRALVALGQLALDLLERPAEALHRLRGDADAGVLDGDGRGEGAGATAYRHAAAFRREFHGVGEQIEHDLLERPAIGPEADRGGDL